MCGAWLKKFIKKTMKQLGKSEHWLDIWWYQEVFRGDNGIEAMLKNM